MGSSGKNSNNGYLTLITDVHNPPQFFVAANRLSAGACVNCFVFCQWAQGKLIAPSLYFKSYQVFSIEKIHAVNRTTNFQQCQ